ncbi:MAG: M64 family metallopeptidase [Candidatus Krumholzibacteria bacterium]|nr:M64 family metallopeptidase [Candidatus Krumholzibacteria bacterium]
MKRSLVVLGLIAWLAGSGGANADTEMRGGHSFLVQPDGSLYRLVLGTGASSRIDLVFVADGFQESELGYFADVIKQMITELLEIKPYSDYKCAFNFWAVDMISPSSASSLGCVATGDTAAVDCNLTDVRDVPSLVGAPADIVYVVINDDVNYLATAYPESKVIISSTKYPYGVIPAHEIGHIIANLADEYMCRNCEDDLDRTYPLATEGEPENPNLTTEYERDKLPWTSMTNARTYPTLYTQECNGYRIGAWEGGGYYAHGIYRPSGYCLMDYVLCPGNDPFCAVCEDAVRKALLGICYSIENFVSVLTFDSSLDDLMRFMWLMESLVRAPIPRCIICDPEFHRPDDAILRIRSNAGPGARVVIVDSEMHEIMRGGPPVNGVIEVAFPAERLRSYTMLFYSGAPTSSELKLECQLTRNGREQPLSGTGGGR